MTTTKSLLTAAAFAATLILTGESVARADLLPPENTACGLSVAYDATREGSACTIDQGSTSTNGICKKSKCAQRDYSHWDREAGSGPPSIEVDCLKCESSNALPVADKSNEDTGLIAKDDSGSGNDGGGCSVGGNARTAAPWLLAFAAALIVSVAGRRRK